MYLLFRLSLPRLLAVFSAVLLLCGAALRTAAVSPADTVTLPVIMYHGLHPDRAQQSQYVISPDRLEEDLRWLTEKGYTRYFSGCVASYREHYNQDNGILPVTAVTAVAMTADQQARLTDKLHRITGKHIELVNRIDPNCLGGVRLDYDGVRLDDTVAHRLDAIRSVLKNTVL